MTGVDFAVMVGRNFGTGIGTTQGSSDSSVWREHITDPRGVVIYHRSLLVNGPRKHRYLSHVHPQDSAFFIKAYVFSYVDKHEINLTLEQLGQAISYGDIEETE